MLSIMDLVRGCLKFVALALAIAPSVLKMYETSHWFRENDDPSVYDRCRDWFETANVPYAKAFMHHDKTLLRVYFFIVPYIVCAFVLALVHAMTPKVTYEAAKRKRVAPPTYPSQPLPRAYLVLRALLEQSWLTPTFFQRYLWAPSQVSTAELLGIATYLVLNIGTFAVRVKRSYPRGTRKLTFLVDIDEDMSKEPIPHVSWEGCEIWAKTIGILAIMNLGWYLILPIGRRSVMLEALNLSWERAVKYHRWIGYYTFLLVLAHGIMYVSVWIYGDGKERFDPDRYMVRRNLNPWGCKDDDICDDDQRLQLRINFYGFTALVFMVVMTIFTLPWIRRAHFELFYYTHHLYIFVLFFLVLHYSGALIYLVPGVAMYMVDKLYPLFAYGSAGVAMTTQSSPDVLEVRIPTATQDYHGGSYVFLNVPKVSWLEWHPFSLTSAPGQASDRLVFHLKACGKGTWTQAVLDAAQEAKKEGSDLTVRIDGFYGHDVTKNLRSKSACVLVGGGIGVTPMVSIAQDLLRTAPNVPVTLLWTVRTVAEFAVLAERLAEMKEIAGNRFDCRVWITLSQGEPASFDDLENVPEAEQQGWGLLTPDGIQKLSAEEQSEQVQALLDHYKETSQPSRAGTGPSTHSRSYVFCHAGLSNATNALVMGFAVITALSSYALTWHIGETNEIEPEDKRSLFDMTLIVAFMAIFAVGAACLPTIQQHMFGEQNSLSNTHVLGDEESSTKSNESSTENDGKASTHKMTLIHEMIHGRLGCRPDLRREFSKSSHINNSNVDDGEVEEEDEDVFESKEGNDVIDVGTLACGPMAMVKSVTEICNTPASRCSWGLTKEDGTQAFFSFTEQDWEW